jgi:circadian clock protein KaiC
MLRGVKLINSGLPFIDKKWGGLYSGGSYLLIGPKKSGKTLLGLQIAHESVQNSEVVLYFTTMRPKDLMIQASSIDFDIKLHMNKNLIIVVRVAPPADAYDSSNPDEALKEYLNDIITVVNQYKPKRLIFDELTPYVGFESMEYLYNTFLSIIEKIEEKDITSLFILGEPAEGRSKKILELLSQSVTGQIYLDSYSKRENHKSKGIIKIIPNVGHTEGEFTEEYYIEPNRGLITASNETKLFQEPVANGSNFENLGFSNLYDYPDFILLLNNQIAMYKSTGQKFSILVFSLDPAAQANSILSLGQLQTCIRNTVEKKNKICTLENKIIILMIKPAKGIINSIVTELKDNLPSRDSVYLDIVSKYITVMDIEITDGIENAEQMIDNISGFDKSAGSRLTSFSGY